MPTEPEVFALADHALNNVVQQIGDDQWQLAIPEWIKLGRVSRDGLTLRALVNYHAYDDAWVPAMVAGKTMDAVGAGKWKDEDCWARIRKRSSPPSWKPQFTETDAFQIARMRLLRASWVSSA